MTDRNAEWIDELRATRAARIAGPHIPHRKIATLDAERASEDLKLYGISMMHEGRRIDPSTVEINCEPRKERVVVLTGTDVLAHMLSKLSEQFASSHAEEAMRSVAQRTRPAVDYIDRRYTVIDERPRRRSKGDRKRDPRFNRKESQQPQHQQRADPKCLNKRIPVVPATASMLCASSSSRC